MRTGARRRGTNSSLKKNEVKCRSIAFTKGKQAFPNLGYNKVRGLPGSKKPGLLEAICNLEKGVRKFGWKKRGKG